MLPPPTNLDPEGHYARLGLEPGAAPDTIVAAYRRRARILHPDVPGTGDTAAFMALKAAYDVLASPARRAAYDRAARQAALDAIEPAEIRPAPPRAPPAPPVRQPRLSDLPLAVWLALAALLCIGVAQVVWHLWTPTHAPPRAAIRPNAPTVPPADPNHPAPTNGPAPVRLAGTPNYYVVPAAGPTVLWRHDAERNVYVPNGQLPPFSAVQALRLFRQTGLVEVRVTETVTGFVEAFRLAPGNLAAARRAYCAYNAGPSPANGEVLTRQGGGPGSLALDNRTTQPAVVKLRDAAGKVAASVFLAPGAQAELGGLPEGRFQPEFAIGELWSRACGGFAAGMRAQRLTGFFSLPALTPLAIPPDHPGQAALVDIPDQAFEHD